MKIPGEGEKKRKEKEGKGGTRLEVKAVLNVWFTQ